MKKLNKKIVVKLVIFSGYLFALGEFMLLYCTFLAAYFNPGKMTLVTVNSFGEADVEFVLIPVTIVFSFIGLYLLVRDIRRVVDEQKKNI